MTNAMTYTSQLKPLPGYDVSSCNCSRALTPPVSHRVIYSNYPETGSRRNVFV